MWYWSSFSEIWKLVSQRLTKVSKFENYCRFQRQDFVPTHIHMGSQVPLMLTSPNMEVVLTFEPQETIKIWLVIIKVGLWLFYAKIFTGLVLRVGSSFLLDPTLNTPPKPHFQKVPCGHPCHTLAVWFFMAFFITATRVELRNNDRGDSIVSYRWTGWVWEMTGWSSRLQKNYWSLYGIYETYLKWTKENRRMSTCNRLD